MSFAKIAAFISAVALSLTVFSGCAARNTNNNDDAVSLPPVISAVPETPPAVGGGESVYEYERDYGQSALEGDFILGDGEHQLDVSAPEINSIIPNNGNSLDENVSAAPAMSADFSQIGALSSEKQTGFPGGPVDAKNRPGGPVAYQEKYGQYDAFFIVPNSDKIYLTFDEGYENGYTSRILDVLKEKKVKAVFFITYPYAKSEPALVKRMIDEGHTVGNHSTKHLVYPDMPLTEAAEDLMKLHDYVRANFGYTMWLFRPPEGAFSEQTLALAQSLGYKTILWSFAYKDYDVNDQPIVIEATDTIVRKAHPGAVYLLHAVSKTNTEVLGDVIDILRSKGFTFADYFYFS